MHFGLWRRWINPFDREALLEATCHFVFDHFGQRDTSPFTALDAGCGVGATLKLARERYRKEMYRILKPRGVLIVLDGYLTKPARSMNSISMWIYNRVREGWWIEEMIDQRLFMSAATATGFVPEHFRSLFLAVAPSAAHVPWVTLRKRGKTYP